MRKTSKILALVAAIAVAGCDDGGGGDAGGGDAGPMGDAGMRDGGPPAASCSDGMRNQDESDVDCGGVCGATCTPTEMCGDNGDCTTNICMGGTCQPMASCSDGTMNGTETDVDCGGAMCNPCDDGEACAANTDCMSGFCDAMVCTTTVCGDGTVQGAETCDDGVDPPVDSAACDEDCSAVMCGDGHANTAAGEVCDGDDAGTGGETASCDTDCTAAMCGDGLVNTTAGETCDGDGAGAGGETASCDTDCTAAMCGDGVFNATAGEECDDGNTVDSDACSNTCMVNASMVTVSTDATFDTDTGELDGAPAPGWSSGTHTWVTEGFVVQAGASLSVRGSRPFVVTSTTSIDIAGVIDAAGEPGGEGADCSVVGAGVGGAGGPGGFAGGTGGEGGSPAVTLDGSPGSGPGAGGAGTVDGSGGGGAGHRIAGTAGGGLTPGAGGAAYDAFTMRVGGSGGGGGSSDDDLGMGDDPGGGGGGGGGFVELTATSTLTVTGFIAAGGGAGGGSRCFGGGGAGGGGSGGVIHLVAPTVVTGAGDLDVSGGLGGRVDADGGDGSVGLIFIGGTCSDGAQNQDETDVDCGGSCGACGSGLACLATTDCASGASCTGGRCRPASCGNTTLDGTETDVDCGGSVCLPCANTRACSVNTDCVSGRCASGSCAPVGEACASAATLHAGINAVTWTASTNDYLTTAPSCTPTFAVPSGPDVVMSFTATTTGVMTYSIAKPSETTWALAVSSAACGTVTELSCAAPYEQDRLTGSLAITSGTTYYFYLVATDDGLFPLSATLDVRINEISLSGATTFDDFEAGPPLSSDWTTGGDVPWSVSSTMPLAGSYSAQAGSIVDLETSTLAFNVACGPSGAVIYDYRVSSEADYDFFNVLIDGVAAANFTGEMMGANRAEGIAPGAHRISFEFTKDDIDLDPVGSDTAWLDNVRVSGCVAY